MCLFIKSLLMFGQSFVFFIDLLKYFYPCLKVCIQILGALYFGRCFRRGRGGGVGTFIILKRCKYEFVFPWPVTIAVQFCVRFMFMFSLSLTSGKKSFVIFPFVEFVHSVCHFFTPSSSSSFIITLFGILLYLSLMFLFATVSFASLSASSFLLTTASALTHRSFTFQFASSSHLVAS